MRSAVFDAFAKVDSTLKSGKKNICLQIGNNALKGILKWVTPVSPEKEDEFFIRFETSYGIDIYWGDKFVLSLDEGEAPIGKGRILDPDPGKKTPKDLKYLLGLLSNEEEMILALAKKKGVKGITENEIADFSSLEPNLILPICLKLEESGKVRILSFSPLVLIYKPSFEFLTDKLISFLDRYHQVHPKEIGISKQAIKKRFSLHPRLLSLVLKVLSDQNRVKLTEKLVFLSGHRVPFSPKEKAILKELDDLCSKGEIQSFSLNDLQKRFSISSDKMDLMIAYLAEKVKVVQAKEGFIVHSAWLEEIISDIRRSKTKTLTVADFKKRTGLSRKYTIPLLELLDQMGVTRRRGDIREVL